MSQLPFAQLTLFWLQVQDKDSNGQDSNPHHCLHSWTHSHPFGLQRIGMEWRMVDCSCSSQRRLIKPTLTMTNLYTKVTRLVIYQAGTITMLLEMWSLMCDGRGDHHRHHAASPTPPLHHHHVPNTTAVTRDDLISQDKSNRKRQQTTLMLFALVKQLSCRTELLPN